ncbi:hypothetical protein ACMD2_04071, partial [Ananas comosus]
RETLHTLFFFFFFFFPTTTTPSSAPPIPGVAAASLGPSPPRTPRRRAEALRSSPRSSAAAPNPLGVPEIRIDGLRGGSLALIEMIETREF